jgi:acyl-CoA thioester hydrolase
MTIPAPLDLWRETVRPEWIDYNGHMNVAYYVLILDHAVDAFWDYVGLGAENLKRHNGSTFAVEAHVTYAKELMAGAPVRCTSRLIGVDEKRIHHYHELWHAEEGTLSATAEFLSLYVDMGLRKVAPMPKDIQDRFADVLAAHSALPLPDKLGHVIRMPGR